MTEALTAYSPNYCSRRFHRKPIVWDASRFLEFVRIPVLTTQWVSLMKLLLARNRHVIDQIDITKFTATQLSMCSRFDSSSRLPALRKCFDASEIAQSLAIALRAALDFELASACWWNEAKGNPAQLIAIAGSMGGADQRESEVGEWLRKGLHGASDSLSNTSLDGPAASGGLELPSESRRWS